MWVRNAVMQELLRRTFEEKITFSSMLTINELLYPMYSAHDSTFGQDKTLFDTVQRKMWWWVVWSLWSRVNSWASINVAQSSICTYNCAVLGQPLSSGTAVHWDSPCKEMRNWKSASASLKINKTMGIIHDSLIESLDWMFTCFIYHLLHSCLEVCVLDWSFNRLASGRQFPVLLNCVPNVQQRSITPSFSLCEYFVWLLICYHILGLCIPRPQVSGLRT